MKYDINYKTFPRWQREDIAPFSESECLPCLKMNFTIKGVLNLCKYFDQVILIY